MRFLNSVGGGLVKGFQSKQIIIVEDEHGFDLPVLISECIPVESSTDEKMRESSVESDNATDKKSPSSQGNESAADKQKSESKIEIAVETAEGENLTVCLAFLPVEIKKLSGSSYECYFVNDSNYRLFLNYSYNENSIWKSRYAGSVEPNSKIFLEEIDKTELNEIERIAIQLIAYKEDRPFKLKDSYSVELRIDTVKFYKLHSFKENDYFHEDALIFYIIRDDIATKNLFISARDLELAMREKQLGEKTVRKQQREKKSSSQVIEIDLHINKLLDNTIGMNNADIMEYQLKVFNDVMKENINHKKRKIVFIHGKGDGLLKNAIVKELKKRYPKCYWQDASFQEYGFGATMVTIY